MSKKIYKTTIVLLLLTANCFSQSSKANLDKMCISYNLSNNNLINKKLINYLVGQYRLLKKLEKLTLAKLILSPKSENAKAETIAFKFRENKFNIENEDLARPKDLSNKKLEKYTLVLGQLESGYELFSRYVNNNYENEYFEKFKLNNDNCKSSLILLMQTF